MANFDKAIKATDGVPSISVITLIYGDLQKQFRKDIEEFPKKIQSCNSSKMAEKLLLDIVNTHYDFRDEMISRKDDAVGFFNSNMNYYNKKYTECINLAEKKYDELKKQGK